MEEMGIMNIFSSLFGIFRQRGLVTTIKEGKSHLLQGAYCGERGVSDLAYSDKIGDKRNQLATQFNAHENCLLNAKSLLVHFPPFSFVRISLLPEIISSVSLIVLIR